VETPIQDYVNPADAIYIIQGSAGALVRDTFVEPKPWWAKVRVARYGYGVLEANQTTLSYQYKLMTTREVIDHWTITKT
jgi:hypothetical protein